MLRACAALLLHLLRLGLFVQGTEIEATLWRDMADQWYEKIQEGKVGGLIIAIQISSMPPFLWSSNNPMLV